MDLLKLFKANTKDGTAKKQATGSTLLGEASRWETRYSLQVGE